VKLADDFCAACADGPRSPTQPLSCQGRELPGAGRTGETGILALSDAAAALAARCIAPAKQEFPGDYDNCENAFLNCLTTLTKLPASCR
jgi:hypothetical protein